MQTCSARRHRANGDRPPAGPGGERRNLRRTAAAGRILPGPVDWFVQGPGGIAHPDVRGTFQTDDGANIYIRYQGVQVWTDEPLRNYPRGES